MTKLKEWWSNQATSLGIDNPKSLPAFKVVGKLEEHFWESHPFGSRHQQFYNVFGNCACVWPFITGSCSRQTLASCARFFALQNTYFYDTRDKQSGRTRVCNLCGGEASTFSHLLCKCPALDSFRIKFGLPSDVAFLRVCLLTKTSKQLFSLVQDLELLLDGYELGEFSDSPLYLPPQEEDQVQYVVQWDGSFVGHKAGLGITIMCGSTMVVSVSVPIYASDATRCEALGPALAVLLLARLSYQQVILRGDSLHVVQLLRKESQPRDIWLYNATQLALDILQGKQVKVEWIPRTQNTICDALARQAVQCELLSVVVDPKFEAEHIRGWKKICLEFIKRFDLSALYPQRISNVIYEGQ